MKIQFNILMLIAILFISVTVVFPQGSTGTIGKVFEIKHKKPSELEKVLRPLVTNVGKLTSSDSLNTITVNDFPENIIIVEEAIKRIDIPPVTRNAESLEFQLNLLFASMDASPSDTKQELPKNLLPVLTQLKSTLKYTHYRHAYSGLNRLVDGGNLESTGVFGSLHLDSPTFYRYSIGKLHLDQKSNTITSISIGQFHFQFSTPVKSGSGISYKDIGITTPLNLNVGETVVVGTASISGMDEAIIVIVTVKKLKE